MKGNLTQETLELIYSRNCNICGNVGYKIKKIPPDETYLSGREVAVECECRELLGLYSKSGVEIRYQNCCFDNYVIDENNRGAIELIKNFVTKYPDVNKSILINGPVGTGKTWSVSTLVNEFIWNHKKQTKIINVPILLDKIRGGINNKQQYKEVNEEITELLNCELLVLDDLGAERMLDDAKGDWIRERIYILLEDRWSKQRYLAITTNCTGEQISEKYGQRITDRIMGLCSGESLLGESKR